MYEMMAVWETPEVIAGRTPDRLDFASGRQDRLLQIAGDLFYPEDESGAGIPPAGGSRVEGSIASRYFGAGPTLAADAIRTGLVDEYHLLVDA